MQPLKILLLLFISSFTWAEENPINESISEYLDFVSYGDGVMSPEIFELQKDQAYIIDVRAEKDYQKEHIEGAVNIEWRQILNHLDELPSDKLIIVYCDTGVLSSKVHLILRLNEFENARVLFGGYLNWLKHLSKGDT